MYNKMKFYNSKSKLPVTDEITKGIISLPIHANLDQSDVDKIIKMTNRFAK